MSHEPELAAHGHEERGPLGEVGIPELEGDRDVGLDGDSAVRVDEDRQRSIDEGSCSAAARAGVHALDRPMRAISKDEWQGRFGVGQRKEGRIRMQSCLIPCKEI